VPSRSHVSAPHSFSPILQVPALFRSRPTMQTPGQVLLAAFLRRTAEAPVGAFCAVGVPLPRVACTRCRCRSCVAAAAAMLGPSAYRQPGETVISYHVLYLDPPHHVVGLLRHPPHGRHCRTSPPRCHGQPCHDKALASYPLRVPFTQLAPLASTPALLRARMRPPHATSNARTAPAWTPLLGISPPAFLAAPHHAKRIELAAPRQAFAKHLPEPLRAPAC
jgi:hypothetical protein